MDLINCRKFNIKPLLIVSTGILLASVFLFSFVAQAQTDANRQAQISAAIQDLSSATGQTVTSEEQAKDLCNQEQYLDVCADIGKKHDLYTEAEAQQVDSFLNEVKGKILDDIKNCPNEECLIKVANELAQKIQVKNPILATNLKLTTALIEEKNSVVQAAKEVGVDFRQCESMDPDTATIELLRQCAKLAKDSRVQKYIPEERRVLANQFSDTTLILQEGLRSGKYQCGDNTLEGCGNFCLKPSTTATEVGIPEVCKQIATEVFGPDGVKQLEQAHQQVGQVKDYYSKKFILTLPDSRELVGEGQIRNACDQAFSERKLDVAKACGTFAVQNGFASQAEVDKGLKLMESFTSKGQDVKFDECLANPEVCRDFIPEDERGRFDAGRQIFNIMRTEIGFDPSQCERGSVDQAIGTQCSEGSKRALAKIESLGLANQSQDARFIVEDIRRHVSRGDEFTQKREQFKEVFSQQGGPGGCKSEAECFAYCSNSTNGAECISFGAQQNISGFRGQEAVQKFQEYNQNLQRPGLISDEYRPYPPGGGPYPPGFPPPGQDPRFTQPGPGFSPPPGIAPHYPPYPPGGPGPVGPSPECFAAIQSGDFARAKTACYTTPPTQPYPSASICPVSFYVACPAGQYRESFRNDDGCWVDGQCNPAPTYSSGPYPTYSPPNYGNWVKHAWKFADGSESSSILNRTDDEYLNYIKEIETQCINLPRSKFYWKSGAGNDNQDNWRNFGIPDCSGTGSPPTYSPYPTTSSTGGMYSCFYPNATKNGAPTGYTVWCEKDYFNCREGSISGPSISLAGLSLGKPSSCESGYYGQGCNNNNFCDSNETYSSCPSDCSGTPYPYPSSSYPPGGSSCSQSLINLLGSGCHQMYTDSSGRFVFCDGPMSKSAKEGDSTTTAGCSGSGGTPYPYPSYTPPVSESCPSGYHYHSESGGFCINNQENFSGTCYNSSGTTQITCPTQPSYTPYPYPSSSYPPGGSSCSQSLINLLGSGCHQMYTDSSGRFVFCDGPMSKSAKEGDSTTTAGCSGSGGTPYPNYTSYPSCPSGQYWDSGTSSCKSNTSYGGCTGTTESSCTSVPNCYWSSGSSYCYYQSTPPGTSYTPYPTSSYTSCPSSQYWDSATNACKTTSFTDCPSGQYWNGSSCVNSTATSYTPYPTSDPSASCASSGGTWDGSSCTYPTYSPPPTTSEPPPPPPPTSSLFKPYMVAHCQQLGRTWNGEICRANGLFARILESYTRGFANILKAFGF